MGSADRQKETLRFCDDLIADVAPAGATQIKPLRQMKLTADWLPVYANTRSERPVRKTEHAATFDSAGVSPTRFRAAATSASRPHRLPSQDTDRAGQGNSGV
jgi:hypothetical protein